jgi:glycosyltransferase involved in cell wall biosynthesis
MRVLIDYRAALSRASGVGEYARQLVDGLLALKHSRASDVDVTIFSSSWKDRLHVPAEFAGAASVDQRIPVSVLNFAWHRLNWPPAEALTDAPFDVAHSLHPLLMPSRAAAQVITIHDLNFLHHPERTRAEIKRDYPALVHEHAARADHVVVVSRFTAREAERHLGVSPDRMTICAPGAPDWTPRAAPRERGYLLFLGTLEPRKNIGTLLDAYERLLSSADGRAGVPDLVLAGRATEQSAEWLERIARPPLAGRARHIGYVDATDRKALYEGAAILVQPSHEEGFGLTALEAMTLGVPVVAANGGAVPEVVGDAGLLVEPADSGALACAIRRMLTEPGLAEASVSAGIARARLFPRSALAENALIAYRTALERRAQSRRRL